MAEMTVQKLHEVIGALYATIAVHEQTLSEKNARITELELALAQRAAEPLE